MKRMQFIPDIASLPGLWAFMLLLLSGCSNETTQQSQTEYASMTIALSDVKTVVKYPAAIRGRQDVDIFPQVSGTIQRVCVKKGEKVRQRQSLFVIDRVPYEATLRTAVANVHAAEAQVETAQITYEGKQELFRQNVVSEFELSTTRNTLAVAKASLEQTRAEEVNARNNLSYTEVKSPTDGVVGTIPYRVGALVGPTLVQPLTTVADNSEMYVYFSISENQLQELVMRYGSLDQTISSMPIIHLQMNNGTLYTYPGANAETVQKAVIVPLEEAINGVENMSYIHSEASNTGDVTVNVYFRQGVNADMAAVNVQNRVSKAQGLLPAEVTKNGVQTPFRPSVISILL